MAIFFTKMSNRLSKSKWCKVYVALAIIHTIVSVVILIPYMINAFKIRAETINRPTESGDEYPPKYAKVIVESSAFICLEIWRLWLALDSILQMNSLTIYASASFSVFSFLFSVCMIVGSVRWLSSSADGVAHLKQVNLNIQIALCVVEFILMIPTLYAAYKVIKDIGWQVYKKIGSSIELQKMYKTAQWFSLLLKIDVFFEVTFIFIVLFTKYYWYYNGSLESTATDSYVSYMYTAIAVFLTLSLPLAREAISRESHWLISIFLSIQFIFLGFISYYTYDNVMGEEIITDWYAFYAYLFSVYLCGVTTIVLTIMVQINFGKGLRPHVQWRGNSKSKDPESPGIEHPFGRIQDRGAIDSDDEDDTKPTPIVTSNI